MKGRQTPLSNMYVLDIETCDGNVVASDEIFFEDGSPVPRQRSWLSGFMNVETYQWSWFVSLEQCLERLFKQGGNQNIEVGIHNLAFDGDYIVRLLANMRNTVTNDFYEPVEGKPSPGQFSVLIDDMNKWYTVTIQVTKKRKVTLWDTLKLFPMPLRFLHNVYNTTTKKIKEDSSFYEAKRSLYHTPTDRELDYFVDDLQVLAETLNAHVQYEGLTFKKTQASQAFYNFTKHFKAWKLRFPSLTDEIDELIRPAYLGGIVVYNRNHVGKVLKKIRTADLNSSYPHQLESRKMPYGKIVLERGMGEHPYMGMFWVAKAIVRFSIKKEHYPCIAKKSVEDNEHFPKRVKWLENSEGVVAMTFCSVDYQTFLMSYDFEVIDWIWSIHWAHKKHKEVAEYIETNNTDKIKYRAMAKEEHDPQLQNEYLAKSQRGKINNNAFYGKFGEEVVKIGKVPMIDDETGIMYYKETREEVLTPFKRKFLPVAIATTAYGRQQYIQMANLLGDDFVYGDTDSAYFFDKGTYKIDQAIKDGFIVADSLELGAWEVEEYTYDIMKVIGAKAYMTIKDENAKHTYPNQEVTMAGLPADHDAGYLEKKRDCLSLDTFYTGYILEDGNGKLRSIQTPTGKRLAPSSFEIGERNVFFN